MGIVQWATDNWVLILQIYAGIVTIASIIVKLTPTTKDDAILSKITGFIGKWIALNKGTKKNP